MRLKTGWVAAGLLLAACSPFVYHSPEATAELRSAMTAANEARIDGPARVQVAGRTTLFVQTGLIFIPALQGERLLRAIGARPTKDMLGLLINSTYERTDMAVVYSKSRPAAEMPDVEIAGWRAAPMLSVLKSR